MTREASKIMLARDALLMGEMSGKTLLDGDATLNIIDKIFDDFEARTCESCKHKYIFDSMRTDCRHNDSPIDFLDLDCFPDFGCNKWEQK